MNAISRLAAVIVVSLGFISTSKAEAATISIDIISSNQIELTMSGTLIGPQTQVGSVGNLFISIPDLARASSTSVSGNLSVGGNSITDSYLGYDNGSPFSGDEIQLRSGINGTNAFAVGDVLSGSGIITFGSAHNLTQSMFDGQGAEIVWTGNRSILQGYATSPTPVPVPASLPLFGAGLCFLGYVGRRRKAKKA